MSSRRGFQNQNQRPGSVSLYLNWSIANWLPITDKKKIKKRKINKKIISVTWTDERSSWEFFLSRIEFFRLDEAAIPTRDRSRRDDFHLTRYSHKNVFFFFPFFSLFFFFFFVIVDTKQSSRKIISRRPRSRALAILALLASHFRSCLLHGTVSA